MKRSSDEMAEPFTHRGPSMVNEDILVDFSFATPIPRQKPKIAIIDDERDQVECLATAFRRQGYDVVSAFGVQAGRELVKRSHPQLVIMDIHLPDGDGLAFCRDLTDDDGTCDIPVIVLSGSDRADVVRSARSAGCQYFLRKPFDPNALLLLAENCLANGLD